jgi:uncharacterized protein YndB with AHSA1/START domain
MTTDLKSEFVADKDTRTIKVSREFKGPRQLVWDCHTKRELLDRWFAPKPLTTETKSMEFRPGGHWHYAMITPDGEKYWSRQDYKTINPIDGYTAQDSFTNETGVPNPNMPGSTWDVTFTDEGARTLVTTVVQYASAEALQAVIDMGVKEGMISTLERLDELLVALQPA